MNIQSRSSIDVIIGCSKYGNYVCIPNFEIGCYISNFNDLFFNDKEELLNRSTRIYEDYLTGASIQSLSESYYLSPKTIQRIISKTKKIR